MSTNLSTVKLFLNSEMQDKVLIQSSVNELFKKEQKHSKFFSIKMHYFNDYEKGYTDQEQWYKYAYQLRRLRKNSERNTL